MQKIHPTFIFACFLCALPVFLTTYPPMVDLPQHAAQISLLKNILFGDFPFTHLFELNLFTPYWLGYALVLLFSLFLDVLTSIKLAAACAVILLPYCCALLRRELKAPAVFDWLFLPIGFGFAFEWGLLNFLVSAPLCMLFLRDAYRYAENKVSPWRMAIWVNLLFFTHVMSMVFFCALAILMLIKPNQRFRVFAKSALPIFASLPLTAVWVTQLLQHAQASSGSMQWDIGLQRLQNFFPNLLSLPFSVEYVALGFFAATTPFLFGGKISNNPARWLPFVFYALWMLFAPIALAGTYFVYNRFGMFGLPLYILMFDFSSREIVGWRVIRERISAVAVICTGVILLFSETVNSYRYERESAAFAEVLEQMEPGKRALGLIFDRQSSTYTTPVYLHYHAWYQAIRNGIVDFSFANFSPQVVHYKDEARPTANDALSWMPWTFKWRYHNGGAYDYFIVRSKTDIGQNLRMLNPNIRLVVNRGLWRVYMHQKTPIEAGN